MQSLTVLPWCELSESYDFGIYRLFTHPLNEPIPGLPPERSAAIQTHLSVYRKLDGTPIDTATLLYIRESDIDKLLAADERGALFETIDLVCFSGIAKRKLFSPIFLPYCCSANFIAFTHNYGDPNFISLRSPSFFSGSISMRPVNSTRISPPIQTSFPSHVELDHVLLESLLQAKDTLPNDQWRGIYNAICQFNLANSDDPLISLGLQWTLLTASFEQGIPANSGSRYVAQGLQDLIRPRPQLWAERAQRNIELEGRPRGKTVRYLWIYEFYEIRNHFAHGQVEIEEDKAWEFEESITLANIIFPQVIKRRLEEYGLYEAQLSDKAVRNSFEKLAGSENVFAGLEENGAWQWYEMLNHSLLENGVRAVMAGEDMNETPDVQTVQPAETEEDQ